MQATKYRLKAKLLGPYISGPQLFLTKHRIINCIQYSKYCSLFKKVFTALGLLLHQQADLCNRPDEFNGFSLHFNSSFESMLIRNDLDDSANDPGVSRFIHQQDDVS